MYIDCAEELRMYGGFPTALSMTPAEIMDKWWRYVRVRDQRILDETVAMQNAFGGDKRSWARFRAGRLPRTQEIDPPEAIPEKTTKRKGRKLTPQQMAAEFARE